MKKYVIDTSVAVKWFSKTEKDTENALELRQALLDGFCFITAPDLLIYELANVLKHNANFTETDVKSALESVYNMGMEIKPPENSVLDLAINIAFKLNVTVYDACFLALAQTLQIPLITADYKFITRVKSLQMVIKLSEIKN